MGELYDFVRAASEKLGMPPEILSGLPVVELTGDPERRYRVLERSVQNTEGVWEDEALDIWDGK